LRYFTLSIAFNRPFLRTNSSLSHRITGSVVQRIAQPLRTKFRVPFVENGIPIVSLASFSRLGLSFAVSCFVLTPLSSL